MFTLLAHYRNPAPRPTPRPTLALVWCAVLMGGCDESRVEGSGTALEETRNFEEVTRVSIHGEGQLILVQGRESSLRIRGDDNIVPLLRSEVSEGVLVLGPRDGVSVDAQTPIVYRLTLRSVEGVEASGAARAEIGPIESPRFSLRVSGASHAEAESIRAEGIQVESSGASDVTAELHAHTAGVMVSGSSRVSLRGSAEEQEVEVSGASNYEGSGLQTHRAVVRASGSSDTSLFADEDLRLEASGASSIHYGGGAQVHRSLSGAASVEAL